MAFNDAKGALYCRTSSLVNADGASVPRQKKSGQTEASAQEVAIIVKSIMEVVSGSLPKDKRVKFNELLESVETDEIGHVFVEVRALVRDADVGVTRWDEDEGAQKACPASSIKESHTGTQQQVLWNIICCGTAAVLHI